jgi:hypothetical protein
LRHRGNFRPAVEEVITLGGRCRLHGGSRRRYRRGHVRGCQYPQGVARRPAGMAAICHLDAEAIRATGAAVSRWRDRR